MHCSTLKHPLPFQALPEKCADAEIPHQHRHARFGDVSEQSWMCSKAPGAVITLSCHCVVIYVLKSDWILFISTIIWLNLRPLILVLFDPWRSRRAASVLWLQGDCSGLGAWVVISCQMHLRSKGPTGNICQCPLHNTRFYGKIEPSSNCRGNSRVSLLTDMSWKLASYFGRHPGFFCSPFLPHHPLKIIIINKKRIYLEQRVLKLRKPHWCFTFNSVEDIWESK